VAGRIWQDVAEIPNFLLGHNHSPKSIREVNLGQHDDLVGFCVVQEA
jgi:hypothetical protein